MGIKEIMESEFTGYLLALIFTIGFAFLNLYLLALYMPLIFLGIIYYRIYVPHEKKSKGHLTPFVLSLSITLLLFFLNSYTLLLLGLILIIIIMIQTFLNKKSSRYAKIMHFIAVLTLLIFTIDISSFQSRSIVPAYFNSEIDEYWIEFLPQNKRGSENVDETSFAGYNYQSMKVWRNVYFLMLKTDKNDFVYNSNQANITLYINLTQYLPNSETPFWKTRIDTDILLYDEFVKELIVDSQKYGYELLDYIETMQPIADYYKSDSSYNEINLNYSFIPMSWYLFAIDFVIEPIEENKELYQNYFESFEAPIGINYTTLLNFELGVDEKGYFYVAKYLTPRPTAPNFFEDLIGEATWNMGLLFIILFIVIIIVAFLQRSFYFVNIGMIMIESLAIIGLFAVLSLAMENPPQWMIDIFGRKNAEYTWAVIESVKYAIFIGILVFIMLKIQLYLKANFEGIFSIASEKGG